MRDGGECDYRGTRARWASGIARPPVANERIPTAYRSSLTSLHYFELYSLHYNDSFRYSMPERINLGCSHGSEIGNAGKSRGCERIRLICMSTERIADKNPHGTTPYK